MKNLGKNIISFFTLALLTLSLAQAQTIWSSVTANKKSVFIGEPVEVSVKVYTTTWFTAGIDPGNIKVDGAYTVFFRNVSISTSRNGQTCPGVELIINVFPNSEEDLEFPVLEIEVQSPKEGDYKGTLHKVKTKSMHIDVKPIPPGFDINQWLVTSNMSINESWKGNLKNVKVGDVLERTISRNAANTVSQLLPPISWDSIAGISQYPALSSTNSHRSKTAISASRTESMRYLFEIEGETTIPEMVINWWNPFQQRMYKRTLEAIVVDVQPNPNLGMLSSIKDSLSTESAELNQLATGETTVKTILGMSIKRFIGLIFTIILLMFVIVLFVKWSIQYRQKYLNRYRNSELFYWRKFKQAVASGERASISVSAYRWIDSLHLNEPTLSYFAKQIGNKSLINEAGLVEKSLGSTSVPVTIDIKIWKTARKQYLQKPINNKSPGWINPIE